MPNEQRYPVMRSKVDTRAETFENLVEDQLNQVASEGIDRIEILNFSVPGYTLVEFVAFLETLWA